MTLEWHALKFDDLSSRDLYQILELRSKVFVVEQNCAYQDIDGIDLHPDTVHELAFIGTDLVCYARIYRKSGGSLWIGRVVVHPEYRRDGIGRELLRHCLRDIGDGPVSVHAQAHLENWYRSLGFRRVSGISPFLEDGIPHVEMIRVLG